MNAGIAASGNELWDSLPNASHGPVKTIAYLQWNIGVWPAAVVSIVIKRL